MSTGGALLNRVEWRSINDKNTVNVISDVASMNIHKSTEIKNNIFTINLKNTPIYTDGTKYYSQYVGSSDFKLVFNEFDQFTVWLKLTDEASDIDSTTWYTDNELIGNFLVEEYQTITTENTTTIQMRNVDTAYLLFNKVFAFAFGVGNNFTSPGIIRYLTRRFSEVGTTTINFYYGTHNDTGTTYATDAKFLSEGGYIQDYRQTSEGGPSTALNGALSSSATTITVDSTTNFQTSGTLVIDSEHISYTGTNATQFTGCTRGIDDTTAVSHSSTTTVYQGFPLILITKSWKALFEWFGDVAQNTYTNYYNEVIPGGTIFYGRAFLFWVDENNAMHFIPADNTVDRTLDVGEEQLRNWRIEKAVFDSVNFVVYNCGQDMYGNAIIYYWFDQTANVQGLKMRYQPMTQISEMMIKDDRTVNPARSTASTPDILRQFPSAYPVSNWSFKNASNAWRSYNNQSERTTLASNAEYNDSLREAAKWQGLGEAQRITARRSGLRYRGQIALKGTILSPGDLVQITNTRTGINQQKLRVLEVTHNITANTWETTIDVEEDERIYGQNYP